jgi:hypothetical protein
MSRPLQHVSPTKNLPRIGIPLVALSGKGWLPKLDRCAMVGEAQASDWPLPNSYWNPVGILWESCLNPVPEPTMSRPLQCVSPTENLLRIGIPLGALSGKTWIPKLDRCAMAGEAQASGLLPTPPIHFPMPEPTMFQPRQTKCSGLESHWAP